MDLDALKRMYLRMMRPQLKLLPYALWGLTFWLVIHGMAEGNWIFPVLGVLTLFAGRAVKRYVRNLPEDDDDDYDDTIYHAVPVEAPEPLDEDRPDKPYID